VYALCKKWEKDGSFLLANYCLNFVIIPHKTILLINWLK
jgi:hypothetical protein